VLVAPDDRCAMFELSATSPLAEDGSTVRTVDVVDTDASGRITRLAVYYG
jgi:hypothetical protein